MTIHWDDAAILWHHIDSTAIDVLALSQHNAPFNSERKIMTNTKTSTSFRFPELHANKLIN